MGWGVDTYLVQSLEPDECEFGTALSFSLLLSAGFILLSLSIAGVFFYRGQDQVAALLLALAVQRLFMLCGGPYAALLQRRFRFRALALIQLVAGMIVHAAAVLVALAGGGAWSLLARDLLDALILLVGARLLTGRTFRPGWNRPVAGRIRRFGVAMLTSQSGELAAHKLDSTVVGLLWGTHELAFYEEAFKLADVTRRASQPALTQVALPAYARLQGDPARRTQTFRRLQRLGLPVLLVAAGALLLVPQPLIRLFFGAQWLGAVPMVRAFAAYALLFPLFDHLRQYLLAQGAAKAVAWARVGQLLVFLPVLAALTPIHGGEGAAFAVDAGLATALVIAAVAARRMGSRGAPTPASPPLSGAAGEGLQSGELLPNMRSPSQ